MHVSRPQEGIQPGRSSGGAAVSINAANQTLLNENGRNRGAVESVAARNESTERQRHEPLENNSRENNAKNKKTDNGDSERELMRNMAKLLAQSQAQQTTPQPQDDCDIFAKLIASQLRKLSTVRRLMLQNTIQNLVYQAMVDEERSSETSSASGLYEPEVQIRAETITSPVPSRAPRMPSPETTICLQKFEDFSDSP